MPASSGKKMMMRIGLAIARNGETVNQSVTTKRAMTADVTTRHATKRATPRAGFSGRTSLITCRLR